MEGTTVGVNMPSLPSVTADSDHRTVTLGELRELVRAADAVGTSDEVIIRGTMIPFHMPDLGHRLGGRLMSIALDEDAKTVAPVAPNRAGRRGRSWGKQ